MQLFKSLTITMAIIAHGAHAAEKTHSHLRSDRQKNDTSAPSLDNVIESLAKYLWSDRAPTPFLVKGSFPASVWIKEHSQLDLPYNDIDVVIDTPTPEDDCQHDASSKVKSQFGPSQFVDSVYVDGVIPGSDKTVQVVTLCDIHNHYDELITKYSDINAVAAGFIVVPNEHGEPIFEKWEMSEDFKEFMHTKTLEIVDDNVQVSGTHGNSIIRLLKKAQQLNMDYILPEWIDSLHGDVILPYYKQKLDNLEPAYKDVIYSRFDFEELYDGNLFMYVGKGLDTPAPLLNEDIEFLKYVNGYNNGRHYGYNNGRHYGYNNGRHYGWKNNSNRGSTSGCTENCHENVATCIENCYCNSPNICSMPKCTENCYSYRSVATDMSLCRENCYCYGNGSCKQSKCTDNCVKSPYEAEAIAQA
jgi:hypothetical protein